MDLDASQEELSALARNKDFYVRWSIIYNRRAPSEALTVLAGETVDPNLLTTEVLLEHPNTPPLVKIWLRGGYGEMSLEEFLKVAQ